MKEQKKEISILNSNEQKLLGDAIKDFEEANKNLQECCEEDYFSCREKRQGKAERIDSIMNSLQDLREISEEEMMKIKDDIVFNTNIEKKNELSIADFFEKHKDKRILLRTIVEDNGDEHGEYCEVIHCENLEKLWKVTEGWANEFSYDKKTEKKLIQWKNEKNTKYIEAVYYISDKRFKHRTELAAFDRNCNMAENGLLFLSGKYPICVLNL